MAETITEYDFLVVATLQLKIFIFNGLMGGSKMLIIS